MFPMMASSEEKREAFRREALLHLEDLHGLGLRLTGGDVSATEELVRETILRAHEARDDDRRSTNVRAWLMTILRNTFVGEVRTRGSRPDPMDRDEVGERSIFHELADADPEDVLFDRLVDREVAGAIEELEDSLRIPLVLADLEGLSYQEIAETVGVPADTVTSRLFRARRTLQRKLYDAARGTGQPR